MYKIYIEINTTFLSKKKKEKEISFLYTKIDISEYFIIVQK